MVINWSIDLGSIVQLIGFIGTILVMVGVIKTDMRNVKEDITDIKVELKALRDVITTQAAQTVRMDSLSKRIDDLDTDIRELQHGEGFVFPLKPISR